MTAESTPQRKKSIAWLVPATLGAGALALSLVTGSLGAYTASITNNNNTAGAGGLTMQETGPDVSGKNVTCSSTSDASNAVNCSTINKFGGKTAMVAALQRPDLIERLCVVDIAPRDYGNLHRFSGYVEEMLRLPLDRIRTRAEAEELFQESDPAVKAFLLQNLRRSGESWRWQANLEMVARDIAGDARMGGWPVAPGDYRPYPHQVLWLVGAESRYVQERDAEPMRALFPRTLQVTVKDAGHWVHTEQPQIVVHALRRFILGRP